MVGPMPEGCRTRCPSSRQEVPINGEAVHFENALVEGKVVVILRPPRLALGESWRYQQYFRGKERRTEFQVQLRFKHTPGANLWVRTSPKPLKRVLLNRFTTCVCKLILSGLRRWTGQRVDYSFGDENESPHISLPISSFMRVQATALGEPAPQLGSLDMLSQKTTQAQISEEWRRALPFDSHHVYTFTFHSMYLDFAQWQLTNLFGIPRIGLESFWGKASTLQIKAYSDTPKGSVVYFDLMLGSSCAFLEQYDSDWCSGNVRHDRATDHANRGDVSPLQKEHRQLRDGEFRPTGKNGRNSSCCGFSPVDFLQMHWDSSKPFESNIFKAKSGLPGNQTPQLDVADCVAEKQPETSMEVPRPCESAELGSLCAQTLQSKQRSAFYVIVVVAIWSLLGSLLSGYRF